MQKKEYEAAASYLGLLYDKKSVAGHVARLRKAPLSEFNAKDMFRASQLSLLGVSNSHGERDRRKIVEGKGLSALLLLRDEGHGRVIIADGYHRLCAIYGIDEDAVIPCKIL